MGLVCCVGLMLDAAAVQAQSPSSGNPFKDGWEKLSGAFSSKKAPAAETFDDSVSLTGRAQPSANTYVAIARLYEQSGKLAEAEKQYQVALKENAKDLAAMLGYARLKERQGKPDEAVAIYQKAAKTFPQEAAVFNNLGLCHARRGTFDEAITALGRATLLQPKNVLYRNNMATVLVEMNRMQEAYSHLRVVHAEPACYYNLGFLLNKKGKTQEAAQHFAVAWKLDPSLTQAKEWMDRLGAPQPSMVAPRQQLPPPVQERAPEHVGQRPLPPTTLPPTFNRGNPPVGVNGTRDARVRPVPPSSPLGNARGFDPLPADGLPPMPSESGSPTPLPPVSDGLREPEIAPLPPVR
jgi:tetratricopeptide (TPR) repeat protein